MDIFECVVKEAVYLSESELEDDYFLVNSSRLFLSYICKDSKRLRENFLPIFKDLVWSEFCYPNHNCGLFAEYFDYLSVNKSVLDAMHTDGRSRLRFRTNILRKILSYKNVYKMWYGKKGYGENFSLRLSNISEGLCGGEVVGFDEVDLLFEDMNHAFLKNMKELHIHSVNGLVDTLKRFYNNEHVGLKAFPFMFEKLFAYKILSEETEFGRGMKSVYDIISNKNNEEKFSKTT